jgi:NitT/TauT family transport system substrate-binding protein
MRRARRHIRIVFALVALALVLAAITGCASSQTGTASGSQAASGTAGAEKAAPIRIGVLPNEDSLPLFVAEKDGLFTKAGLDVKLVMFPSAAERDAAMTAGSIDAASGDIIAAALLTSHGFPVTITTLELGATPQQGRFGILAAKNSGITSLEQLASKGALAQSSGTLATYSADKMLEQAGVSPASVKRIEVKKLPVRFELLSQGKVPAAVLPEPLLSLGEKQGLKLLADDAKGPANISQTVLYFSNKYLGAPGGKAASDVLNRVWDEAVAAIDANPDAYRALLVEKARLPQPIATEYKINQYPQAQLPKTEWIQSVLDWMKTNKLLPAGRTLTPAQLTGQQ